MYLRCIVISLLMFFGFVSTLFTAFHCKGDYNAGLVSASAKEVRPKNVYIVAAAAAAREKTHKGRKMVVDKSVMARGKQTTFRRTTLLGNKSANYVAFTEDYKKPRHHPPKNN